MDNTLRRHPDGSVSLIRDHPGEAMRMSEYFTTLHQESAHYRGIMDRLRLSPTHPPLEILDRFPPTNRDDYRNVLQWETLSRLHRDRFVCDYSSGSTDQCVLHLSTPHDELGEQKITEEVFRRVGMVSGDAFVCMDVGFPEIYDFYFRAARNLGVRRTTYLHLTRDFERCLQPIRALSPTVLLTLPSILVRAWPHLRGLWPWGESPIRSLIHMGEPMHADFRREVAETLGCKVYSFYGTTETGGMAGECFHATGCHFNPSMIGPTIVDPEFVDDRTVQGELFLTTWYLKYQSVVKYCVGDLVRITTHPCPCGEATPRLIFLERTHDSFVLAGMKLRYQTILDAFKRIDGRIDCLSVTLTDLPPREGHTLLQVSLLNRFEQHKNKLLNVLQHEIFELNDFYQFGLVRFQIVFHPENEGPNRKLPRILDQRQFMENSHSPSGELSSRMPHHRP